MLAHLPVLAANTGGPVETIADGKTGWLRDPDDVSAWSDVMRRCLELSADQVLAMGVAGERRVKELFGRDKMAETLDESLTSIIRGYKRPDVYNRLVNFGLFSMFVAFSAALAALVVRMFG